MRRSFVILAMLGVAAGANETLVQSGTKPHPTDAPKRHVEKIAVGRLIGDNQFVCTDESSGERQVRITHDWVERSASRLPEAPPTPTFPPDKGEAEGAHLVFRWPAPTVSLA